jgi:hypothetical protein
MTYDLLIMNIDKLSEISHIYYICLTYFTVFVCRIRYRGLKLDLSVLQSENEHKLLHLSEGECQL